MIPRNHQRFWVLALALAAMGWATRDARADAIPYGTIGWVDTPAGGSPGLVSFSGNTGTVAGPGSLNLGQFAVAPAALTGSAVNYTGDQVHVIAYSGRNQSEVITGTLGGSLGAGTPNMLSVTFNSVMPFGTGTLPFTLNVPTGIAMTLSTTPGSPSTIFSAAATPAPEPTSVAVFGMALGGLALWRRRRAGR